MAASSTQIKEAICELQWRGGIKPEPEPTAEEKADIEVQKLAAFEKCASCTTCEWSRPGLKGCKECLGQFYRTHRLTKLALEYQRKVVSASGGT